jgi:hypothetical protein
MKATEWDAVGTPRPKAFELDPSWPFFVHYVDGEVVVSLQEPSDGGAEMHLHLSPEEAAQLAQKLTEAVPFAAGEVKAS